jgi:D-ribose pyranose/furanose isomerase RbsD
LSVVTQVAVTVVMLLIPLKVLSVDMVLYSNQLQVKHVLNIVILWHINAITKVLLAIQKNKPS